MNQEIKATLEIIIHEIQEIITAIDPWEPDDADDAISQIDKLLDTWITANDLHPEHVTTISVQEAFEKYGIRIK